MDTDDIKGKGKKMDIDAIEVKKERMDTNAIKEKGTKMDTNVIEEKKLHVWNGSEKVEFLYKPFERKSIIVAIQFELFMGF